MNEFLESDWKKLQWEKLIETLKIQNVEKIRNQVVQHPAHD